MSDGHGCGWAELVRLADKLGPLIEDLPDVVYASKDLMVVDGETVLKPGVRLEDIKVYVLDEYEPDGDYECDDATGYATLIREGADED